MEITAEKETLWNRNYLTILIVNCIISISFFIVNPTFPVYIKSLVNDLGIVGLLSSVFMISATMIRPFSGYASDKFNKKKIFVGGLVLLIISVSGYIFFKSIALIALARLFHGIGMALATTAFGALASDNIPDSRMAEGMGYYGLGMVLGMSIGPTIGLALLNRYGASAAFGSAAGFSLLGAVMFFSLYQDKKTIHPRTSVTGKLKIKSILINIEKTAIVPASLIFFIGIVVSSITTYLALYATERGISNIGYFFVVQSVAVLLSRIINGKVADRRGYGVVIIPTILCLVGAMVLLYFAQTPIIFMATAFLYGLGYGTLTSACQALSVVKAKPERRGLAISTYFLGMDAGNGIGMILCGIISKAFGYAEMYLLCIVPLIIGLVIFVIWGGTLQKLKKRSNRLFSSTDSA
jgi:MFS family permease